ncbi:ATP-dependent helicase [Patescibacteria group bacterium]|nr:ATP-dependent helicase [Patescibacteria group bacterium]
MKVSLLLAGPGTGKTLRIVNDFLKDRKNLNKILILSFTNATINDLVSGFKKSGIQIQSDRCMTLSKYSLKINPIRDMHVLNKEETKILDRYSKRLGIELKSLCGLLKCITFEEMITGCIDYIKTNPQYIKDVVGNLELLIVDEFQDFNESERTLIEYISNLAKETILLGDDDQCVYEFKKADPSGIISKYNDKNISKIFHDSTCHRCPSDVVASSNSLIKNNKNRIPKELKPEKSEGSINFKSTNDLEDAAEFTCNEIAKAWSVTPHPTIMVLAAAKFIVEPLKEALNRAQISVHDWFDQKIGIDTLDKIWQLRFIFGNKKLLNLMFLSESYRSTHKQGVSKKLDSMLISQFMKNGDIKTSIKSILDLNIFPEKIRGYFDNEPEFEEFFKKEQEFQTFEKLLINNPNKEKTLEKLEILTTPFAEFDPKKVNIMSIRKSKGLQANIVFVIGVTEGITPGLTSSLEQIEAERRRFYVAITRTIVNLYLISPYKWVVKKIYKNSYIVDTKKFRYRRGLSECRGQTSRFIAEMQLKNL